ncbi:collagen alpha-1(I) chain-like [Mesoplodon densirostris]|uniref:collagen alpha-1(I) chain-like n=1 Tax=Mesoplodon densirostris TaxID=48708 RepID=UPI0028DBBD5C|nr:collagen alpha-1(I) chain-like [Mesoplodon densirostris]
MSTPNPVAELGAKGLGCGEAEEQFTDGHPCPQHSRFWPSLLGESLHHAHLPPPPRALGGPDALLDDRQHLPLGSRDPAKKDVRALVSSPGSEGRGLLLESYVTLQVDCRPCVRFSTRDEAASEQAPRSSPGQEGAGGWGPLPPEPSVREEPTQPDPSSFLAALPALGLSSSRLPGGHAGRLDPVSAAVGMVPGGEGDGRSDRKAEQGFHAEVRLVGRGRWAARATGTAVVWDQTEPSHRCLSDMDTGHQLSDLMTPGGWAPMMQEEGCFSSSNGANNPPKELWRQGLSPQREDIWVTTPPGRRSPETQESHGRSALVYAPGTPPPQGPGVGSDASRPPAGRQVFPGSDSPSEASYSPSLRPPVWAALRSAVSLAFLLPGYAELSGEIWLLDPRSGQGLSVILNPFNVVTQNSENCTHNRPSWGGGGGVARVLGCERLSPGTVLHLGLELPSDALFSLTRSDLAGTTLPRKLRGRPRLQTPLSPPCPPGAWSHYPDPGCSLSPPAPAPDLGSEGECGSPLGSARTGRAQGALRILVGRIRRPSPGFRSAPRLRARAREGNAGRAAVRQEGARKGHPRAGDSPTSRALFAEPGAPTASQGGSDTDRRGGSWNQAPAKDVRTSMKAHEAGRARARLRPGAGPARDLEPDGGPGAAPSPAPPAAPAAGGPLRNRAETARAGLSPLQDSVEARAPGPVPAPGPSPVGPRPHRARSFTSGPPTPRAAARLAGPAASSRRSAAFLEPAARGVRHRPAHRPRPGPAPAIRPAAVARRPLAPGRVSLGRADPWARRFGREPRDVSTQGELSGAHEARTPICAPRPPTQGRIQRRRDPRPLHNHTRKRPLRERGRRGALQSPLRSTGKALQNGGVSDHRGQDSGEKDTERHSEKLQPTPHPRHTRTNPDRAKRRSGRSRSKQQALDGLYWRRTVMVPVRPKRGAGLPPCPPCCPGRCPAVQAPRSDLPVASPQIPSVRGPGSRRSLPPSDDGLPFIMHKFLGDAQYSGPSPSLYPSYEATTGCKRGSSCILTLLVSKETGYPGFRTVTLPTSEGRDHGGPQPVGGLLWMLPPAPELPAGTPSDAEKASGPGPSPPPDVVL